MVGLWSTNTYLTSSDDEKKMFQAERRAKRKVVQDVLPATTGQLFLKTIHLPANHFNTSRFFIFISMPSVLETPKNKH